MIRIFIGDSFLGFYIFYQIDLVDWREVDFSLLL